MLEMLTKAVVPYESKYAARRKSKEYAECAEKTKDRRHQELANVYSHLSTGKRIISINKAMEIGGVNQHGLPVFAIAAAHAKWVWFKYDAGWTKDEHGWTVDPASAFLSDYNVNPSWNHRTVRIAKSLKRDVFRFRRALFPIRISQDIRARVPLVPPKHVPRWPLKNYQILWEANWQSAPKDPLLLRRISREFFVVEAEWDLTDVERLVLEMAAFSGE